ncbi:dihydrolipoamide acetyltransferase family protein [uncultured Photobacterium sp.]|uniref:dihydrolipoamide acetyltransferase family protein n=1 Tax=uncultured Photobacterium sp. TaxID=173973 RepID=UPI002625536E|nr:dihydrolipoamide acetyltransferase family protein [uncultured Photobacterium sp.]
MKSFSLPDLGEGLAESEIIEWHVDIGDTVEVDQVILTVETAKATVEVPAPYGGKIVHRYGNEGDVIGIGSLLLEIDETEKQKQDKTTKSKADAATVVGNVSQHPQEVNIDEFWVGQPQGPKPSDTLQALPSARRLAQKLGVDLHNIEGSGPEGIIIDSDVYQANDKQRPGTEVLKGARRTMVNTMTESHHNVASVTITEEAVLANWSDNEDITSRLIQAIVAACHQEPALNAWFDAETMTRCLHSNVNIGIAVDSKHGLYVPVLRNADKFCASEIRQWLDETVTGIRNRKIGREQLQHATITLTNFGAIAGIFATPVVTSPQVAIVGAGRIIEKLELHDNKPVSIKALPLSMTFDHRACTGGEAARFMKEMVKHLEQGE